MCTRKLVNIDQDLDGNSLVRQSPLRRTVAWLTLIAYIGQPMVGTAQVVADQAAAANNRPVIDATANGLPLVQIATPNAAGISHNQYTQYNVDPAGVILNNSQNTVLTQQAGYVAGNQNLANGAARVILNEVTSTNRSQLNGYTEVAGQQAEVIIANPNGITCNGCGFINTSRGVLTTGTPVMGASGSLDSLRVTGGDIQIGSSGLNGSNVSQLDLIARSVQVNGQLWAPNLNVITGANLANYNTLGVQVIQGTGTKPTVGIDVALLGGMYANKIRLIGTEAGVGVNSLGNLSAQAGDFILDNQGQITLGGSTTASGNLTVNSNTGITNSGTLYSQQAAQLTSAGGVTNTGLLSAKGNLNINAASLNSTGALGAGIDVYGNATQNGNLSITAQGQTVATGTNIAGGNMSILATDINLANSKTTAWGGITLNATAGNIDNTNGLILGGVNGVSNVNLAATGNLINSNGKIGSGQDLAITAATIIGSGQAIAGRDASISLQGNYTNAAGNVIKANRDLLFNTSRNFINQSTLEAVGNLSVAAANIDNQTGAIINANLTKLTTAGDITNAGRIEGNTIQTQSNNFNNTATVIGNVVNVNANNVNNLNVAAIIAATQSVNLIVANALVNQDGATIYSLGDINIGSNLTLNAAGYLTGNAASVTNRSATIESVGNMRISANSVTNDRTVVGVQWGPTWTGAYVPGNPRYTPTYSDQQFTATTTPAAQILSGANMWLSGGALTNNYSDIIAAGALNSQLSSLTNSGAAFLRSTTLNGWQDTPTLVLVGWSCNILGKNCSPNYAWITVTTPYAPPTTYANVPGSVNVKYLPNTQPAGTAPTVSKQTVATGVAVSNSVSLPALTVPSSGLYTIQSQPGQPYLVVTDPRFTNYANFVSSGYMLSRLALDPQQMQKRLGDGFYEQQMVTQQITVNTGRRYLGDYTDAQSQFIALMNSGIDAAKDFNLTVGVALTAAQINSLKHDIVWMVDREVTLPNGSIEHVLAPQVYLSNMQEADLKPSGALIAANIFNFNSASNQTSFGAVGNFNNSGTIRTNTALSINAKDITNRSGTISSGGNATLIASNDILNLSGKISGDTVSLTAGNDIRNERTSQTVTRTVGGGSQTETAFGLGMFRQSTVAGVATGTELGLDASISATHSLNMSAERDISIAGASVNAGSDATINAGRDLSIGVLTTTNSATTDRYAAYRNDVTQHTSNIQTGGNLTLASGNDMHLTSATLDVGKDAVLVSGGDLTLDASKNSTSSGYIAGTTTGRFNDETVLGTTLNAGGNATLIATRLKTDAGSGSGSTSGRTDGKGNISLQSTAIASKTGKLIVAADANVNIGVTEENHNSLTQMHAEGGSLLSHTKIDTRSETWRTDTVGSSLSGDSISITSGNDINVIGSSANAENGINVAAMRDVNIAAATATYGSDYYSHESNTGLQLNNAFSITDHGPDITSKAHTDGTKQSFNRSSFTSNNGNLNIMAGGNLIASGTDLGADKGDLALTAGGTVALLAGQDTFNQSSSTVIVTDPNFFTKQRRTITDTNASLDYQGSTAQGKSVKVNSGADIVLQAADVKAGEGGIALDAGNDIRLLAAADQHSHTHTERLQTDGYLIQADGAIDGHSDRRINNKYESQTVTNQVTKLTSGGDITSHSGRNTLIEASKLDAQSGIDLSAGTEATKGDITFAAVKDSSYINDEQKKNSDIWQGSSGHGEFVETVKLANIKTGKGLKVNATGDIIVDIPEVPKEAPAPVEKVEPIPTKGPDGKPLTKEQKAALIAEREAKAAEKAAQAEAARKVREEQRLNEHLQALAGQSGQEWIGQLVKLSKEKPDSVKLQQVNAALEHWDYSHGGLTPEATAVIAIVVTYFTAGAGAGAVGAATGTTAATAASTYVVTTAVVQAAITTLAIQASTSLINNKGNVGKTLDDMGKSENVKALAMAMVTAGVLSELGKTMTLTDGSKLSSINAKSDFPLQLQKNLINNSTSAVLNHAMYGGDLQAQLEQSLKSAFIDTGAAQSANWIGDQKFNSFNNKLAHAIAGCAVGAAKAGDCSSGALGAAVGELSAEWYGGNRINSANLDLAGFQTDTVNFARMMAGIAVAITGGDANAINLAASAGGNAAENNYLNHNEITARQTELANCTDSKCTNDVIKKYQKISDKNNLDATTNVLADAASGGAPVTSAALEQEKARLTAMLTGPTTCASDPSCQIEVNRSISDIQGIIDTPGVISRFFNTVNGVQMALVPLGVAGEAASGMLGLGQVGETGVILKEGEFINRVWDSRWTPGSNYSGMFGGSYSPTGALPINTVEAITGRGLNIPGVLNNAERGAIFEVTRDIPAISRTSIGGIEPEIVIAPAERDALRLIEESISRIPTGR